jgi:hypothetical protein
VDEELTEDQIAYYRDIFEQYDEDKDQRISMEENLAQDKIIADEQQKPFDEVPSRAPAGRGRATARARTAARTHASYARSLSVRGVCGGD